MGNSCFSGGGRGGPVTNEYTITGSQFNVENYGAAGDGVTDDSAAIQAAIDAAEDSGELASGKVELASGKVYKIVAPLTVTKPIWFEGNMSRLKRTTDGRVMLITSKADSTFGECVPGFKLSNIYATVPPTNDVSVIKHLVSGANSLFNTFENIFVSKEQHLVGRCPCAGIEVVCEDIYGYSYSTWKNIKVESIDSAFSLTGDGWITGCSFMDLITKTFKMAFHANLGTAFVSNEVRIQMGHQQIIDTIGISMPSGGYNRITGTLWRDNVGEITAWDLGANTDTNKITGMFQADNFIDNGANNDTSGAHRQ